MGGQISATDWDLFGSLTRQRSLPVGQIRARKEGPPANKSLFKTMDFTTQNFRAIWRRSPIPARPSIHARIPRITAVEQLPQIIISDRMAKRSTPLRRPTAGQQGGCRGGSAPPPKIITFSAGQRISGGQQGVQGGQRPPPKIITFSAGQQISGGQQGVQGGQRPPAQHYSIINLTLTLTRQK